MGGNWQSNSLRAKLELVVTVNGFPISWQTNCGSSLASWETNFGAKVGCVVWLLSVVSVDLVLRCISKVAVVKLFGVHRG